MQVAVCGVLRPAQHPATGCPDQRASLERKDCLLSPGGRARLSARGSPAYGEGAGRSAPALCFSRPPLPPLQTDHLITPSSSLPPSPPHPHQIIAAYDVLLMRSMQRRLSGAAPIDPSVRFADVSRRGGSGGRGGGGSGGGGGGGNSSSTTATRRRSSTPAPTPLAGGLVTLSPARASDRPRQAAAFGGLALWAAVQASTEPAIFAATDTAGLQTAAAAAAAIWFLRDGKGLPLGRAAGLAVAGLVAGALLGFGLQAALPAGALASAGGIWACPGVLTAEAGILGLYGVAALLA